LLAVCHLFIAKILPISWENWVFWAMQIYFCSIFGEWELPSNIPDEVTTPSGPMEILGIIP